MKISEAIKKLQEIKEEHGDLDVTSGGWPMTEDCISYDIENHSLNIWY